MASFLKSLLAGGLNGLTGGGYEAGRRQALKDAIEKSQVNDSQFRYGNEHYLKPQLDAGGLATGSYAEDQANIRRDQPIQEELAPQFFHKIKEPDQVTPPSTNLQGNPVSFNARGQEIPLATTNRILKSKEHRQAELMQAKAATMPQKSPDGGRSTSESTPGTQPAAPVGSLEDLDPGAPDYQAQLTELNKQKMLAKVPPGKKPVFAQQQEDFGAGDISGARATPEVVEKFNPSPFMRSKITGLVTSAQAEKDPIISIPSLPQGVRQMLGIDGEQGGIRRSTLNTLLNSVGKNESSSLSPATLEAASAIENGVPASTAMRRFAAVAGRQPNKAEIAYLNQTANRTGTESRFTRGQDQQSKRFVANFISKSKSQLNNQLKPTIEAYRAASTILNLINQPNTDGFKRALQTMLARSAGEKGALSNDDVKGYGGSENWWERFDQWKSSVSGQGMTESNKYVFQQLAKEYMTAAEGLIRDEVENSINANEAMLAGFDIDRDRLISSLSIDNVIGGITKRTKGAPKTVNPNASGAQASEQQRQINKQDKIDKINNSGLNPSQKRKLLKELEGAGNG